MIPKSTAVAALDKYNLAVKSSLTSGTANYLPSVASAFNNSLWCELENGVPVLKFRRGGVVCIKRHDKVDIDDPYLVVWLPFNRTVAEDWRGNTWTAYGTPVIQDDITAFSSKSLYLDGESYLWLDSVTLAGQDFTVETWMNMSTTAADTCRIFYLLNITTNKVLLSVNRNGTTSACGFFSSNYADYSSGYGTTVNSGKNIAGTRVHLEVGYSYAQKTLTLFINGKKSCIRTECPQYQRSQFQMMIGAMPSGQYRFAGTMEHFRVWDGIALHTENFTPPTASDYT